MKLVLTVLFALLMIASCGKKTAKKTLHFNNYVNTAFVDDIELFMPELRALFRDQLITDHFTDDAELIFIEMNLSPGKDRYLGKTFSSLKEANNCSYYHVRPYSAVLLSITTHFDTCLNPIDSETQNFPGNYNYELNPDLKEALELTPDRISVKEVVYEGQSYVGFGIQKDSGFNLSQDYKEYVVVPDFPLVLNPVVIYDSQSGEVRALKGIQVR